MPNNKREKKTSCGIGNPFHIEPKDNINFTDNVGMPFNDDLCSKNGFEDSTTQTINWHNIASDCITYKSFGLDTLKKFLDFYISHYNNLYSVEFRKIMDLSIGRIVSFDSYKFCSKTINDGNQTPYYVYTLINKEKNLYRIGITGQLPLDRLKNYIYVSTVPNPSLSAIIKYNNCDLDMRKFKDNRELIPSIFEFRVLYVVNDKIYALLLEKFLTVFINRFPNKVGFDLSINNYYNPIVANLGFYSKKLDPNWVALTPIDIIPLIKKHKFVEDILIELNFKSPNTLNKKLRLFNIGINSVGGLLDARAYILKPFLETAFKHDLDINDFYKLCIKNGITFFENFSQKALYLDKICNYIWHDRIKTYHLDTRHNALKISYKRARKIFIAESMIKYMKNPLYNSLAKILRKLYDNGFVSRNPDEFKKIMRWVFEESFTNRQDSILRKIFTLYFKQLQPILTFDEILQILNIPILPENLVTIRHKLYNVFQISGLDKIRLGLWNDEDLFHPFADDSDSVKLYVMNSTHILRVLNNYIPRDSTTSIDFINDFTFEQNSMSYQKIKSLFTIEDFANYLNLDRRSADYQIKTNLIPLGFVKSVKVHSDLKRGRYEEFSLTQIGIDFLNYVFS